MYYNNIHELYYNLLNAETKLKDYMEMSLEQEMF